MSLFYPYFKSKVYNFLTFLGMYFWESLYTRTPILLLLFPNLSSQAFLNISGTPWWCIYINFSLIPTWLCWRSPYFFVDVNRQLTWARAGHEPSIVYDIGSDTFLELKESGISLVGVDKSYKYQKNRRVLNTWTDYLSLHRRYMGNTKCSWPDVWQKTFAQNHT